MLDSLMTLLFAVAAAAAAGLGFVARRRGRANRQLREALDEQTRARELERELANVAADATRRANTHLRIVETSLDQGRRNQLERP